MRHDLYIEEWAATGNILGRGFLDEIISGLDIQSVYHLLSI